MIKKIEIPTEVPAVVLTKVQYECDSCGEKFDREFLAKEHHRNCHTFIDSQSIPDVDELPSCLRGDHVVRFATEEAFIECLGHGGRRHSQWSGPGWYVRYWSWSDCGRCSSPGCGHDETNIVPVSSVIFELEQHLQEVQKRLAALKKR